MRHPLSQVIQQTRLGQGLLGLLKEEAVFQRQRHLFTHGTDQGEIFFGPLARLFRVGKAQHPQELVAHLNRGKQGRALLMGNHSRLPLQNRFGEFAHHRRFQRFQGREVIAIAQEGTARLKSSPGLTH